MQSVRRVTQKHDCVPPDKKPEFLALMQTIRFTDKKNEFDRAVETAKKNYPRCSDWLNWWLRPINSSMGFNCSSRQNIRLLQHKEKTSNAVESYYSALYKIIKSNQSLELSLRYILQYAQYEGKLFTYHFNGDYNPDYAKKKKIKKTRKNLKQYSMALQILHHRF
jgi:hypothetical protein